MQRRVLWAAGAAGCGGLLATAALSAAVAFADTGTDSTVTDNAFSIGGFTFDPGEDGFAPISPLSQLSPLLGIGGASINKALTAAGLARQEFDVFGNNGEQLGSVETNVNVQNLLGIESIQLRVIDADGVDGDAAGLPAVGTVYSVTDLGGGFQSVYMAVPGADGEDATITNVLVTPLGNMNLDWLFAGYDATHGLNPGDAFAGLGAGTGEFSDNAFTIDGATFDPGVDGFSDANELFGIAPLMGLGGGVAVLGGILELPLYTQDLDVYGADGSELGSVETSVNTLSLLGLIETTQFTVTGSDYADGVDAGLPTDGTVYSVTNLGGGFQNIYTAVPGTDGDSATITNTLVTPWGNADLSSMFAGFDATQPLDPGSALTGLGVGTGDFGDDAFALGNLTFDPGADGFTGINPMFGVAPLLAIGGGELAGIALAPQDLDVYGADGNLIGSVDTTVNVSNLFGMIETTQFTITGGEFADGVDAGLPTDGTVYSVTDLFGLTNIYQAIPGIDGAAATISNVLVTPFGDLDLSWMFSGFDATAAFDPGDILAGLDFADLG